MGKVAGDGGCDHLWPLQLMRAAAAGDGSCSCDRGCGLVTVTAKCNGVGGLRNGSGSQLWWLQLVMAMHRLFA